MLIFRYLAAFKTFTLFLPPNNDFMFVLALLTITLKHSQSSVKHTPCYVLYMAFINVSVIRWRFQVLSTSSRGHLSFSAT